VIAAPPARIRRVVYMGTPALAVPPLLALHEAGYDIPLVLSRPDARRSRRGEPQPSPVKAAALDLGLPVTDSIAAVSSVDADLSVVVAYGRIIPTSLLESLAMVNIHFSLLPRWRGAAPVERAILAGDTHTGVCLMAVEPELDTGAIYRRQEIEIGPHDTLDSLRNRLVDIGTSQLVSALSEGLGTPVPQVGEPVYASKITKSELEIDWCRDAAEIHRLIRVGGAWTTWRGRRLKVIAADLLTDDDTIGDPGSIRGANVSAGRGSIRLVEVQPEGKSRIPASAWLNGARPSGSDRLGA